MSSGARAQPRTARELLFGDQVAAPEETANRLLSPDVGECAGAALEGLPKVLREPAVRDITTAVVGLLDHDLADMLVAGWQRYDELTAAAQRSLVPPGSSERVALDEHSVTWAQRPSVDLVVDGATVATVHFELSVSFDVRDLIAVVRAGRLVELQTGSCDVTATFAVEGGEIVKREAHIELPGAIPLGRGITLVRSEDLPKPDPGAAAVV